MLVEEKGAKKVNLMLYAGNLFWYPSYSYSVAHNCSSFLYLCAVFSPGVYVVHFRTADKFARGICMQSAIFIRRIKFWLKTLGLRQQLFFIFLNGLYDGKAFLKNCPTIWGGGGFFTRFKETHHERSTKRVTPLRDFWISQEITPATLFVGIHVLAKVLIKEKGIVLQGTAYASFDEGPKTRGYIPCIQYETSWQHPFTFL